MEEIRIAVLEAQTNNFGIATLGDVVKILSDREEETYIINTNSKFAKLSEEGEIKGLENLSEETHRIYITNIKYGYEVELTEELEVSSKENQQGSNLTNKELEELLKQMQEKIDDLEAQLKDLEEQLEGKNVTNGDLQEELKNLKNQIQEKDKTIQDLQSQVNSKNSTITSLQNQVSQLQNSVASATTIKSWDFQEATDWGKTFKATTANVNYSETVKTLGVIDTGMGNVDTIVIRKQKGKQYGPLLDVSICATNGQLFAEQKLNNFSSITDVESPSSGSSSVEGSEIADLLGDNSPTSTSNQSKFYLYPNYILERSGDGKLRLHVDIVAEWRLEDRNYSIDLSGFKRRILVG